MPTLAHFSGGHPAPVGGRRVCLALQQHSRRLLVACASQAGAGSMPVACQPADVQQQGLPCFPAARPPPPCGLQQPAGADRTQAPRRCLSLRHSRDQREHLPQSEQRPATSGTRHLQSQRTLLCGQHKRVHANARLGVDLQAGAAVGSCRRQRRSTFRRVVKAAGYAPWSSP